MNQSARIALIALGGQLTLASLAFGQPWTPTSAPVQFWSSVASSADGTKLVAVAGDGNVHTGPIYLSTNSGASWTPASAPITYWTAVASSADGTKLVAGVYYPCKIYTSTNSGTDWTQAAGAPAGLGLASIASSADGAGLVIGGRANYIYTSADAGVTWTRNNSTYGYWNAFASSADGANLAAAADSGISTSTNSGAFWAWTGAPHDVGAFWSVASSDDGTRLIAAAGGELGIGPICTSADSGSNWTVRATATSRWTTVASSADGTHLIAAAFGPGPLYTSTDSGATWLSNAIPPKFWSSVASSADGSKLVAAVKNGGIYTWHAIPALNISIFNTDLVLAWPSNSASSGFMLQQNSDLATANWTDLAVALTVTNQQYQATLSAPPGSVFYRLISR